MYTFMEECLSNKKHIIPDEVEEEERPLKEPCECIMDICQEQPEMEEEYQFIRYSFENITITHPPLLKIYYWESFDMDGLNERLASNEPVLHHSFRLPARLVHSRPLKVIFWLRNLSDRELHLNIKRLKLCECMHKETRVGFNQYRQLYHCPHRRLAFILQEEYHMQPDDLIALNITFFFFFAGDHKVSYQLISSDGRILLLDIYFQIDCYFTPEKCVMTDKLVPVNIRAHNRFVQPIWVRNLTMCHLTFVFQANNRGLSIVNTNLTVPCQSIWPLIVEYRPTEEHNELELAMNFEAINTKFPLEAPGVWEDYRIQYTCPSEDYDCNDYLYVIYPNRLVFEMDCHSHRTLIVAVTNNDQKCVEFRFQNYIINDYFATTFTPTKFRLKAHRSKLIMVHVKTFDKIMYFHRIPLIMEVHKIVDHGTRIAKELLQEVESIDDPKWAEETYMEHVYLHLDIIVSPPQDEKPLDPECVPVPEEEVSRYTNMKNWCVAPQPATRNTIFEKLFWEYLAKSEFLRDRNCDAHYKNMTYEQVLEYDFVCHPEKKIPKVDKKMVYDSLTKILWNSCIDLSKTFRFISIDQVYN